MLRKASNFYGIEVLLYIILAAKVGDYVPFNRSTYVPFAKPSGAKQILL
jgi:hypothetical protein